MTLLGTAGKQAPAAPPPAPTITELGNLRRQINQGHVLMAAFEPDDDQWRDNIKKYDALCFRYYDAIIAYKRNTPGTELADLEQRGLRALNRAWLEDDPDMDEFERVLTKYMAVVDCQLGARVAAAHLDAQARILRLARERRMEATA